MAKNIATLKLLCTILMLIMVVSSELAQAITCGQVAGGISPCIGYLTRGGRVSRSCCNAARHLNTAARNTPARRQICRCLKTLAVGVRGIKFGLAAGLPGKCGIRLRYRLSPSTNCNRIR